MGIRIAARGGSARQNLCRSEMDMQPLISIIIANYNYGRFLEDAIRSIVAENLGDQVELIVCDAASTDNSVEIIRKYTDKIAWWCSEKDDGQSSAFNKGFSQAKGKYLTWLNADDVIFPGGLRAIIREMVRHPDCEWFVGSMVRCDRELKIDRCSRAHRFSFLRMRYGNVSVGGPSSFFSRSLWQRVGGVDEDLHYLMDIDLWHKFVRQCHARYRRTTDYVWAFRVHEDSKMSGLDVSSKEKAKRNREKARREGQLLLKRHPMPSQWVRRFVVVLTLSWPDKILSWLDLRRLRGRCAIER